MEHATITPQTTPNAFALFLSLSRSFSPPLFVCIFTCFILADIALRIYYLICAIYTVEVWLKALWCNCHATPRYRVCVLIWLQVSVKLFGISFPLIESLRLPTLINAFREKKTWPYRKCLWGHDNVGGNIYHRIDIYFCFYPTTTPHVGLNNDIRVSQTPADVDYAHWLYTHTAQQQSIRRHCTYSPAGFLWLYYPSNSTRLSLFSLLFILFLINNILHTQTI